MALKVAVLLACSLIVVINAHSLQKAYDNKWMDNDQSSFPLPDGQVKPKRSGDAYGPNQQQQNVDDGSKSTEDSGEGSPRRGRYSGHNNQVDNGDASGEEGQSNQRMYYSQRNRQGDSGDSSVEESSEQVGQRGKKRHYQGYNYGQSDSSGLKGGQHRPEGLGGQKLKINYSSSSSSSSSEENSNESYEIRQAQKQYHNTDPKNSGNGRLVHNEVQPRYPKSSSTDYEDGGQNIIDKNV